MPSPLLPSSPAMASELSVDSIPWLGSCTEGWESLCLEALDHTPFGVIFEVILLIASFLALALLCDNYLVPAIECLCLRFKIREDVAGAIFVALGSSAPEIIINAIASMKGQVDSVELGIGAVIGSGAIAFLLIPAICTIFAPQLPVEVKRRPLLRDISFYFLSLILVIYFISDGEISLYEAGTLCGLYIVYLLVVVFSSKVRLYHQLKQLGSDEERQRLLLQRSISFVDLVKQQKDDDLKAKINAAHGQYGANKGFTKSPSPNPTTLSVLTECNEEESFGYGSTYTPNTLDEVEKGLEPLQYHNIYEKKLPSLPQPQFDPLIRLPSDESLLSPKSTSSSNGFGPKPEKVRLNRTLTLIDDVDENEEEEITLCNNPVSNLLYSIFTGPTQVIFAWTIPEAKPHGDLENMYPVSFTISFLYLAFFSMVISAVFSRWTVITGLGGDFFGLILVSAAAELPDLVQSIAASKAGYSSMAMACLSSQIANILVGFGLSWFVAIWVRNTPIKVPGFVKLTYSAFIQVCNVILFTLLTLAPVMWYKTSKVHMTTVKAQTLFILYGCSVVGFAVFAYLLHT